MFIILKLENLTDYEINKKLKLNKYQLTKILNNKKADCYIGFYTY